jgi:aspartate/glutamate racemase
LIGIILLDTKFPRLLGDVGNPKTFPFPVIFEKVEKAIPFRVVKEGDPGLIAPFVEAARTLERRGAKAITTSCGFLAVWQQEIASAVDIPVFTSSLIQVPWAHQVKGGRGRVGVLTVDAASLTKGHFDGVEAGGIPVVVRGMDPEGEFQRVYVGNNTDIDLSKAEHEVVSGVSALVNENRDVSSIVLECTNMPVFGRAIRNTAKIPVFDIVTLTNFIWSSVARKGR